MPTQARLVLICRNLDVSHEWLVTGRPPMRPGIAEPHEPYNSMPRLTDEERLHLDRFRAADAIHRRLSDLALLMDDQPGNEDVHLGKKKVGNARP